MPIEILFAVGLLQYGHICLAFCFLSTMFIFCLIVFPYLGPNLPAEPAFFAMLGYYFVLVFKGFEMGLPGFEPGSPAPKAGIIPSWTTTPNKIGFKKLVFKSIALVSKVWLSYFFLTSSFLTSFFSSFISSF